MITKLELLVDMMIIVGCFLLSSPSPLSFSSQIGSIIMNKNVTLKLSMRDATELNAEWFSDVNLLLSCSLDT